MKMERTECSKTLAYKIQTPGNYPEESIEHGPDSVHFFCILATVLQMSMKELHINM